MEFDRLEYLKRLGVEPNEITPTAEGLAVLQLAQASRVVFENMTPLTGNVPELDEAALWGKMVVGGRGGYCFELNGLFGMALEAFGFEARPFLARVRNGQPRGGARSHLGFIVTIEGQEYLADCGFGGGAPILPMRFALEEAQAIRDEVFRLHADPETGETVLERQTAEGWRALYAFEPISVQPVDVEAANFLSARWEKAPFPNNLMMTIVTETGRNNLFNRSLKIIRDGEAESRTLEGFDDFRAAMTGLFNLPDNEDLFGKVWTKIQDR